MKRITLIAFALAIVAAGVGAGARPAAAGANLCVAHHPGASDTAGGGQRSTRRGHHSHRPGNLRGRRDGGRQRAIVGAGANQTVISGGGPVLTLGVYGSHRADDLGERRHDHGRHEHGAARPSVTFAGGMWIPQSGRSSSRPGQPCRSATG